MMRTPRSARGFAAAVAVIALLATGCGLESSERKPRTTLFVGVDTSGSFQRGGSYNDAMTFLAYYIYGHLHELGGLDKPRELFVGAIGGRNPDEPKAFHPIQDFAGKSVQQIQHDDPGIDALVASPHRILAFRTFAYIRVGILLGELLFEQELAAEDADENWVEALLRDPRHHDALHREVRAVAEEIAADPKYADDEPLGPDEDARDRFREFARKQLAGD